MEETSGDSSPISEEDLASGSRPLALILGLVSLSLILAFLYIGTTISSVYYRAQTYQSFLTDLYSDAAVETVAGRPRYQDLVPKNNSGIKRLIEVTSLIEKKRYSRALARVQQVGFPILPEKEDLEDLLAELSESKQSDTSSSDNVDNTDQMNNVLELSRAMLGVITSPQYTSKEMSWYNKVRNLHNSIENLLPEL